MQYCLNNTLINSTGTSNSGKGIFLYFSLNNTLINSTGTSNSSLGIQLASSSNNTLRNNTGISNSSYGVLLSSSANNTFINSTGTSNSSYGIYIYSSSNNNSFYNQKAIGYLAGSIAVNISSSNNTLFQDCINISGGSGDIYLGLNVLNTTFLNCSYRTTGDNETVGAGSSLVRKWYYRAYANNTGGNPVVAEINATNSTGTLEFSIDSNSAGWTNTTAITDYWNIGGTRYYYSNYTMSAYSTLYSSLSHTYNASLGNNLRDVFTFSGDYLVNCSNLTIANKGYTLQNDVINNAVTNGGTCMNIMAQNVTLDCNGHYIYSIRNITGVYTNQYNTTVKNCNVTVGSGGNSSAIGIYFYGSNYGSLINNTAGRDSYAGIYLKSSSNSTLRNNIITGNLSQGIYLYSSSNSTLISNLGTSNSSYGIRVESSSNNTLINNTGTSNSSYGIYLYDLSNSTIINNTGFSSSLSAGAHGISILSCSNIVLIHNNGTSNSNHGIYFSQSSNSTFSNNTGRGSSGIVFEYSSNNQFINNFGIGSTGWGIIVATSSNDTLINNTGTGSTGIDLSDSSGDIFINNTALGNATGFYLDYSSNVSFYNQKTIGNNSYGIQFTGSTNISLQDCVNITGATDVRSTSSNVTFLNCSYRTEGSNETVDSTSSLLRKWYYRAYANDTNGNNVIAEINATNITGTMELSIRTNSSGWTNITTITDYWNIGGTRYYYSNYTMRAYNNSYAVSPSVHTYNTSLGNNLKDIFTFLADLTPPFIQIVYPANNSNNSNTNLNVNYTVSDSSGISSCWYSNDTYAVNLSLGSNCVNITNISWSEGQHNITVWANDTAGNTNSSSVSMTIDSIIPLISFVYPTNDSGITININNFLVNVSAEDSALKNVTLQLYNISKSLINTTISYASPLYINFSSLNDGIYYYNATAYDYAGNFNSTETRNITINSNMITDCSNLTTANRVYVLLSDITNSALASGVCMNVTAQNITLDCQRHFIYSIQNITGVYSSQRNTTIQNCNVTVGSGGNSSAIGIYFYGSNYSSLINNTAGTGSIYGIYLSLSSNDTLTNNYGRSISPSSYGIYLSLSSNNSLINNTGISNSSFGIQLVSYSRNNTLINNTGISNSSHGILIYTLSNNNLLINNTGISNSSSSGYGIYIYSSSNNTLINNTGIGNTGPGIYSLYGNGTIFINNRGQSNKSYGIYFGSSHYLYFVSNKAITNISYALYLSTVQNSTFLNNSARSNTSYGIYGSSVYHSKWVNNSASSNSYAVYLSGRNDTLINNTGASNTTFGLYFNSLSNSTLFNNRGMSNISYGIYLASCYNDTVTNNIGTSNTSIGFGIVSSRKNNLTNNIGTSNTSYGIYLSASANNTFINNTGTSNTSIGIYIQALSNDNIFINNTGATDSNRAVAIYASRNNSLYNQKAIGYKSGSTAVNISRSNDTIFWDCLNISGAKNVQIDSNVYNATFINCSYNIDGNNESVALGGSLAKKWYYRAYANNSGGSPVVAEINATNSTGTMEFSIRTNSSGWTNITPITDYWNINGTKYYYSNYTLNAYNSTYAPASHTYNSTLGNNLNDLFTFIADSISPLIQIIFPLNNTNSSNVNLNVNYTVLDNVGISSCWYSNDTYAVNLSLGSNCVNITNISWSEGQHNITVWVNDTAGNKNSSSVRMTIDTIQPAIGFVYPTNDSGITININNFLVNVSAEDSALKNITLQLYNITTSLINTTISYASPLYINFSSLDDGIYYYNATAYDYAGNFNSTETRNITIQTSNSISIYLSPNLSSQIVWQLEYVPATNISALGNGQYDSNSTSYYVNISVLYGTADLYMKANANLSTAGGDILGLGNETYSYNITNSSVPSGTKIPLSTDYQKIGDALTDKSTVYLKFYLSAPSRQPAGTYNNTVSILAMPHSG